MTREKLKLPRSGIFSLFKKQKKVKLSEISPFTAYVS